MDGRQASLKGRRRAHRCQPDAEANEGKAICARLMPVGAEQPEVALRVADREVPGAVGGVGDLDGDVCAGSADSLAQGIDLIECAVDEAAAGLQAAERLAADAGRRQHHDRAAELELGVDDVAVIVAMVLPAFAAERALEPVWPRVGVAVLQSWVEGRGGLEAQGDARRGRRRLPLPGAL